MSATVWATRRRAVRRTEREGGQTLVEFALLLPLLLLLLFGTIAFGRIFFAYLEVVEIAHDAARVASLGGSTGAAQAAGLQAGTAVGLNAADLTITVTGTAATDGGWVPDTAVTANVQYTVGIGIPMLWPLLGHALNLNASVTMVEEGG